MKLGIWLFNRVWRRRLEGCRLVRVTGWRSCVYEDRFGQRTRAMWSWGIRMKHSVLRECGYLWKHSRWQALCWLFLRSKFPPGRILPWWSQVLFCLGDPYRIVRLWAAGVCDLKRNAIKIGDTWWGYSFLADLGRGPYPTPWFRIVERDKDGFIVWEIKRAGQEKGVT